MGRLASDTNREIKQFGLENVYQRYYSSYRGVVISNEDPEMLGRLKLSVPQVWGIGVVHDYWAWSKGMFAGKGIGLFAIPNVGDIVWVSFEAGNQNMPIWEYGHFGLTDGENDVPTAARNNGTKPTNVVLQSTSGHRVELDDAHKCIKITDSAGNVLLLDDNGVKASDKSNNTITMNASGVSIDAQDNTVKLYSGNNSIEITPTGVNIHSIGSISIGGGFEALYNRIPGAPIADISQIGNSTKVKIG